MSGYISLKIDQGVHNFEIDLARFCYNCIGGKYKKRIVKQDCDICKNKRVELTEDGNKIITLVQHFLPESRSPFNTLDIFSL